MGFLQAVDDAVLTLTNDGNTYKIITAALKYRWRGAYTYAQYRRGVFSQLGRLINPALSRADHQQLTTAVALALAEYYHQEVTGDSWDSTSQADLHVGAEAWVFDDLREIAALTSGAATPKKPEAWPFDFKTEAQTEAQPTKEFQMNEAQTTNAFQMNVDKSIPLQSIAKTFIFGVDVDTMSDASVFDAIKVIEDKIGSLDAIKSKPKKLIAEIASLKKHIDAIKLAVDDRPAC